MKLLEKGLPVIVATILMISLRLIGVDSFVLPRFDLVMSSLITVVITIIGFILTIITIFIAIGDTETFKAIKSNDKIKLLNKYLTSPILFGVLLILFCFYLTITVGDDFKISNSQLYPLIFLITYETISVIRIAIIMSMAFNSVMGEQNKTKDVKEANKEEAFN